MEADDACTCAVGNSNSTVSERVEALCADNQEAVVNNLPDRDQSSNDHTVVNTSGDTREPQNDAVEELPEYASVVAVGTDSTDGGPTRVVYENLRSVNKDIEAARERGLISEAPPTYRQLFGEQKRKSPTLWQRLTRWRQSSSQSWFQKFKESLENNKLAATFVVSGGILLLLSLPVSMVIIGGLNVGVCSRHEIPLYLLIAGFILIAEIIFQAAVCIGMRRDSAHETVYRTLRFCDCLAIFLFIWLLVGTYWICTISFLGLARCGNPMDDIVYVNTTVLTDSEGGTQISVVTPPTSVTPARDCSDCQNYVYSFTAFVIMLQYLTLIILFIFCCSVYFKKYGR